jgi:hypothetical protein
MRWQSLGPAPSDDDQPSIYKPSIFHIQHFNFLEEASHEQGLDKLVPGCNGVPIFEFNLIYPVPMREPLEFKLS